VENTNPDRESENVPYFTKGEPLPNRINPSTLLPFQLRPLLQQPSLVVCQIGHGIIPGSRRSSKRPVERETKHRLHSLLLADQEPFRRYPNFLLQGHRPRKLATEGSHDIIPSFINHFANRRIGYCLLSFAINLADRIDSVNCPSCSHSRGP
jgi:hypothetical protein